jgi:hypothetical protein
MIFDFVSNFGQEIFFRPVTKDETDIEIVQRLCFALVLLYILYYQCVSALSSVVAIIGF